MNLRFWSHTIPYQTRQSRLSGPLELRSYISQLYGAPVQPPVGMWAWARHGHRSNGVNSQSHNIRGISADNALALESRELQIHVSHPPAAQSWATCAPNDDVSFAFAFCLSCSSLLLLLFGPRLRFQLKSKLGFSVFSFELSARQLHLRQSNASCWCCCCAVGVAAVLLLLLLLLLLQSHSRGAALFASKIDFLLFSSN